jgi:putative pre-16S rRNA nuclease
MIKSPVRAAGIDLGTVRVGLAVADELGMLAHPRPFLDGRDARKLVARLTDLAREEKITCFVVGLPRRLDGREGSAARRARKFAADLSRASGVEVELVDERLTTREAVGRLRERGLDARAARTLVDSEAAAILLQSWLDQQRVKPS